MLQCRQDQHSAVWLEVPAQYGHVIPIAAEAGFVFHHAEGNLAVMFQWLGKGESRIPDYATHQIGVSGLNQLTFYLHCKGVFCCDTGGFVSNCWIWQLPH